MSCRCTNALTWNKNSAVNACVPLDVSSHSWEFRILPSRTSPWTSAAGDLPVFFFFLPLREPSTPDLLSIHLRPGADFPTGLRKKHFMSVTKTDSELASTSGVPAPAGAVIVEPTGVRYKPMPAYPASEKHRFTIFTYAYDRLFNVVRLPPLWSE